jgi:predicted alpha/beta superfamily hydrolase
MIKYLLLTLLIHSLTPGFAQVQQGAITIGKVDSITSTILGEKRKFWVHVPNDNATGLYADRSYPVVYVLDGPQFFHSVTGLLHHMSISNNNSVCPPMIVVAISNTDRSRDLTPTRMESLHYADDRLTKTSGGGEHFIAFLEKELKPYIESHYPVAPYSMLVGHSLGGLFAIHTFFHHADLFNSYVAIDPSLWWDNQSLLLYADTLEQTRHLKNRALYLAIANTIPAEMNLETARTDTSEWTSHIRANLQFADILASQKFHNLSFAYQYYPDETHTELPLLATYDALKFFFKTYRIPDSRMFDLVEKDVRPDSTLILHYKNASAQLGYEILPPERITNSIAYMMMEFAQIQPGRMDAAYHLFAMNVKNYPESANVHDSMGDWYMALEDTDNAILCFQKALDIKETKPTRQKLEMLLSMKAAEKGKNQKNK